MAHNDFLTLQPGELVSYQGASFTLEKVLDLNTALIKSTLNGKLVRVSIKDIQPTQTAESEKVNKTDLAVTPEKDWEEAQKRFDIIKPIVELSLTGNDIVDIATKNNLHYTTVYRWVKRYYESGGKVISLVYDGPNGGKGKSRLSDEVDQLISAAIESTYLNKQRKPILKTYEEVCLQCKNLGIEPPHLNTVRNRILSIREETMTLRRYGKDAAKYKFEPIKGHFPAVEFPLSVVQIDHTKVDIILVDEVYRKPVGRPWVTMAIDIYSRMVVGLYLSFDPPGALAAGMCVAHSILPKEIYLSKLDVNGDWPCWGVMQTLHLDNAKEFRGIMLERACQNYGIEIDWRPVKTPNWGGHIERLLGTFAKEIHTLPGTTFSNTKDRKGYDSEKNATFTLHEFERWLVTLVNDIYHKRKHSALGVSPFEKYNEGIFGSQTQRAKGLPARIFNEQKVKLDFMPFVERTIQEYGIIVDHIYYYDEVLRRWIHSKEGENKKTQAKRKFIFKRDPRDISVVYFYDPELKDYYEIPYRDTSHPPITLWEHKEILRRLVNSGEKSINENLIFEAYKRLREIENGAVTKTIEIKKHRQSSKKHISQQKSLKKEFAQPNRSTLSNEIYASSEDVKPFDEIDDDTPYA